MRRNHGPACSGTGGRHGPESADAIADLGRVLTISPDDTRANANRAVLRERIGDLAGAISDYTVAFERDPEAADLLGYRADLRVRLDDLATAVEDYAAAIRVATERHSHVFGGDGSYDPAELDLRAKLAKVYERQGNTDAALREYETILSLNERHPDGLDGRARLRAETELN